MLFTSQLIKNELIKIEPLPLPKGLIFYLDYTYPPVASANTERIFREAGVQIVKDAK